MVTIAIAIPIAVAIPIARERFMTIALYLIADDLVYLFTSLITRVVLWYFMVRQDVQCREVSRRNIPCDLLSPA